VIQPAPDWETRRNLDAAALIGHSAQTQAADDFAAGLAPVIQAIRNTGANTLSAIAKALNGRGIRPPRVQQLAPVIFRVREG
jgi:hypothetical protein